MEKMTAQISDSFTYLGESYAILAISENRKLFDPEEYGLHLTPFYLGCLIVV